MATKARKRRSQWCSRRSLLHDRIVCFALTLTVIVVHYVFLVVEDPTVTSAIPPAISQAPKEKSKKVKAPKVDEPKESAAAKEESDLAKIREKHAKELASKEYDSNFA